MKKLAIIAAAALALAAQAGQTDGTVVAQTIRADGTTAYALAVEESALEASPRAKAVYEELMLTGIQEYVRLEGAGY